MGEIFTREQAKASDHELYDLMMAVSRQQSLMGYAADRIHRAAGDDYRRRFDVRSGWKLSLTEAIAAAQDAASETAPRGAMARADAEKAIEHYQERHAALRAAEAAQAEQDREWEEHGRWPRYSVVPGGHIHSDMGCFTFHRGKSRTDVRWAFPVSGDSVEEAIEVYGEALCTHCYPDAPVDKTTATVPVDADGNPITRAQAQAVIDARAAEKKAKLDAKNAKAVFDPGTGELVVDADGRALKTEVSVNREILRLLEGIRYYGDGEAAIYRRSHQPDAPKRSEFAKYLVSALAAKRGVDAEALMAEYQAKDAKKARR